VSTGRACGAVRQRASVLKRPFAWREVRRALVTNSFQCLAPAAPTRTAGVLGGSPPPKKHFCTRSSAAIVMTTTRFKLPACPLSPPAPPRPTLPRAARVDTFPRVYSVKSKKLQVASDIPTFNTQRLCLTNGYQACVPEAAPCSLSAMDYVSSGGVCYLFTGIEYMKHVVT